MKFGPREMIIAAVVAMLAVAVLIVVLAIVPMFGRLASIGSDMEETRGRIEAAEMLIQQRQSAKASASDTEARLIRLANQIPDSPQLPSLIVELQDTANEAGLKFAKLEPKDLVPGNGYTSVPVNIVIEGRWVDVVEYLRRISKVTRQIRISAVTIAPVQEEGQAGASASGSSTTGPLDVTASIDIEVYYAGEAGSSAATATAPPAPAAASQ